MQRGTQLDDRRIDLFRRHDARAQSAVQAERSCVALPGQHTGRTCSLACREHAALRSIVIDDDDRLASQIGLFAPDELERQGRQIETSDLH